MKSSLILVAALASGSLARPVINVATKGDFEYITQIKYSACKKYETGDTKKICYRAVKQCEKAVPETVNDWSNAFPMCVKNRIGKKEDAPLPTSSADTANNVDNPNVDRKAEAGPETPKSGLQTEITQATGTAKVSSTDEKDNLEVDRPRGCEGVVREKGQEISSGHGELGDHSKGSSANEQQQVPSDQYSSTGQEVDSSGRGGSSGTSGSPSDVDMSDRTRYLADSQYVPF
jgi:hypothetical protein